MKLPAYNPYLPSWEYVPDGEPHVFDGRVYVYGSHDAAAGGSYCPGDYVCWSAPETDLADWRFEGVIFRKTDDPSNMDGAAPLYAPDVAQGPLAFGSMRPMVPRLLACASAHRTPGYGLRPQSPRLVRMLTPFT